MLNPDIYLNQNIFNENIDQKPIRDGYGDALVELGEKNKNVVVLTADLAESTRAHKFAEKFPERFIECGVAEQNMAGIAAGLGVSGKIAFISSYATFSPGKNWETIRTTIIYNDSNVKIAGHHSGIITGPDGATHQATEDIAITRCWPNIKIISPCDYWEAKKATLYSAEVYGPFYLRFVRDKTPIITTEKTPFNFGKIEIFWISENPQLAIFATGHLVYQALLAAKELKEENIDVLVLNVHTIKPLEENKILEISSQVKGIISLEDHQVIGGLGSAIAEVLAKKGGNIPKLVMLGLQNTFGESGTPDELIKKYQMDKEAVKLSVKKLISS
ncbi:MAG: transketolase family protein [Patescibacteria group bacterium]|nr:transketolase family protein [Patescibacteria group bacterium]